MQYKYTCPSLHQSLSHELPSSEAMLGQSLKRGQAAVVDPGASNKFRAGGGGKGAKGGGKDGGKASSSKGEKSDTVKDVVAKKKEKGTSEDSKLQILIVKTLLRHSQQHRDAESVIFTTYLAPAVSFPIQSALYQTKQYAEAVKERGHGLGPPHIYAAAGLLQGFEEAGVTVLGAKELKEEFLSQNNETRADNILFCRITRVYKEDTVRLTMACSGSPFGVRLKQSLELQIAELPNAKTGDKESSET